MLDFVGHHRKEFRFDQKLRALTGATRAGVERQVEEGFPFLPSGCSIVMDRQAQTMVLENIRSQIANRWQQIVAELRSYGDSDLGHFLDESGIELSDVLREEAIPGPPATGCRVADRAGIRARDGATQAHAGLRTCR